MEIPPPVLPPIAQKPAPLPLAKRPFAFQAALASVLAPAIAFGLGIVVNIGMGDQLPPLAHIIVGSLSIVLILLGFIFGIIALFGVRHYGKKRILGRSIAGICINGVLIALMVISIPMYKRMAERAKEIQQQKSEQQQPSP